MCTATYTSRAIFLIGGCYVIAKRNGVQRHSVNGISKKFKRMSELYKVFSSDWKDCLDYSDESLLELYNYESYGGEKPKSNNGYSHGKKWLNLHVEMWKEDIESGLLFKKELYEDEKFPHWWLDSIFKE
jgi:hypothetical protein